MSVGEGGRKEQERKERRRVKETKKGQNQHEGPPGPLLGTRVSCHPMGPVPRLQGSPAGWLESSQAGPNGHAVSGSPSRLALPLASQ